MHTPYCMYICICDIYTLYSLYIFYMWYIYTHRIACIDVYSCDIATHTILHVCEESESHSVESNSLRRHGLYSPWNSPGQNTGVGSLSLLQMFPTQGSNPGLPHCRQSLYLQNILYLSHQGSPLHVYVCVSVCVCDIYTHTIWHVCILSHCTDVWLSVTPWTVLHQAPLSVGFSRQEYWSELSFPPPGDLPNPGIKLGSPKLMHGFTTSKSIVCIYVCVYICVCVSIHNTQI